MAWLGRFGVPWSLVVAFVAGAVRLAGAPVQGPPVRPDVIYVPTPPAVVARMLALAQVGPGDVVYDLGSGDGRIVITAVRDFGAAFGVGVELDPVRIRDAVANASQARVGERVYFLNQSFFDADLSSATVVTLYLLPAVNQRLLPKLRALKPGTRIVSHDYHLGLEWPPDHWETAGAGRVFLYTVKGR
ncbi:MAG: SAM-dependent methyltransferase [Vicinamibacterales bacterium]